MDQVKEIKPILAVITPTYNRRKLLPNLYASLEAQTEKDFEWLVVDDGSTDGTDAYIAGLTEATFPIKYLHLENGGKQQGYARHLRHTQIH